MATQQKRESACLQETYSQNGRIRKKISSNENTEKIIMSLICLSNTSIMLAAPEENRPNDLLCP